MTLRGRGWEDDIMKTSTLAQSLAAWIEGTLGASGGTGPEHCFTIRPRVRIPGAGPVDLLTLRHDKGSPDRFRVDLWSILSRPIEEDDADPLLRRLHAFQAWYSDLVESAETQGFRPDHRLYVCGNLVGTALRPSPLLELLSQSGSSLFLWKWKRKDGVFDVTPAYGRTASLGAERAQLKGLLDHLPWQDAAEREERAERAKAANL